MQSHAKKAPPKSLSAVVKDRGDRINQWNASSQTIDPRSCATHQVLDPHLDAVNVRNTAEL